MVTIYTIDIGEGDAAEASKRIYRAKLDGVSEELQKLAREYPSGSWKTFSEEVKGKLPYAPVELTKKLLQTVKDDTVHLAYGPKTKNHFWVNINTMQIE